MKKIKISFVLILSVILFSIVCNAQAQSKTYKNTITLLSKMERSFFDSTLRTLFRNGDKRIDDLIQALDDDKDIVSVNAQIVIRALGNEKGIKALYKWYATGRDKNKGISIYLGSLTPLPLNDWEFQQIGNYLQDKESKKPLMNSLIFALILDDSEKSKIYFRKMQELGFYKDLDISKARKPLKLTSNLAKSVLNNAFFLTREEKKYSVAKLMAYNQSKDKALIYIKRDFGVLMEAWYHVVVEKENNSWSFYSIAATGNS